MTEMTIEQQIRVSMADIAALLECELVDELHENTVLLESGLDSLGFAMLIAKLEEDLGYDPFVLMQDAIYPRTLGELVELYERYREHMQ